jgi:hypothetical protein
MILNSESVRLVRENANRLAGCIRGKDDLVEIATAGTYEQVLFAIETILTNTEMYFDDEILAMLDENSWKSFKAVFMMYTLNNVNRNSRGIGASNSSREYIGATAQA